MDDSLGVDDPETADQVDAKQQLKDINALVSAELTGIPPQQPAVVGNSDPMAQVAASIEAIAAQARQSGAADSPQGAQCMEKLAAASNAVQLLAESFRQMQQDMASGQQPAQPAQPQQAEAAGRGEPAGDNDVNMDVKFAENS